MKINFVGKELVGGDLAERVVSLELSDDELYLGPIVVEAPELEGLEGHIGALRTVDLHTSHGAIVVSILSDPE